MHGVRRRFARVWLVTALATGAGLVWAAAEGDSYTATARIVVAAGEDGARARDPARLARTEVELLRDPALVRGVIPSAGPAQAPASSLLARCRHAIAAGGAKLAAWFGSTPPGMSDAAGAARIAHALQVRQAGDTDVLTVSFTWNDPATATAALGAVMARYETAASAGSEAREAARRLAARLGDTQGELTAIETRLAGGTNADALRGERARLQTRLDGQRASFGQARLERDLAQRKIDGVDHAYRSGGWVDAADAADGTTGATPLAGGFAALLDKRSALLAAGRADSAEMRALDRETARTREQTYALVRQVLAGRLAGQDDRLAAMRAAIADGEATLLTLDRRLSEAEVLEAERTTAAARVAEAARTLDSARLRANAAWVGAGDAPKIGEVTPPAGPDWPSSAAVVGVAALLGLAAGVASAAWAEARRRVIERHVDVSRHLGLEVLACLEDLHVAHAS